MNVSLRERDIEIFTLMSRFGFVTVNQLSALVTPTGNGASNEISKYKSALYIRLSALKRANYISCGPAPTPWGSVVNAYFLAPGGACVLSDLREIEYMLAPRWLEKKRHFAWVQGPHDMLAGNFVANLVGLSRVEKTFVVDDFRGSRDCRFYIPNGDSTNLFNPDLYYDFRPEGDNIRMFVEIDTGNLSLSVIRRKANRIFSYFATRQYMQDLDTNLFPRTLFIAPTVARLKILSREILHSRDSYKGPDARTVHGFPFWFATYGDIEIKAIDEGRLTRAPFDRCWKFIDGESKVTPFDSSGR